MVILTDGGVHSVRRGGYFTESGKRDLMKKMPGCCSVLMTGCRSRIMAAGGSVTPCGHLTLISF